MDKDDKARKKTTRIEEERIRQAYENVQSPSLDFLREVFLYSDKTRSKLATNADWSFRPLHPDLLEYAAKDAYYSLAVFYHLLKKVSY